MDAAQTRRRMEIDRERLRQELKRMKELIANDPAVLARFDTDGNGVIDGEEWEAVRQVVIQRLKRKAGFDLFND